MNPAIAEKLQALGPVLNAQLIEDTFALYAARVPKAWPGVSIVEDLAYGPHERHRLDVFAPAAQSGGPMPVVLFVPGGGFVGGAKSRAGVPFYQNVGVHFARNGVVGVTMNYRLAPEARWPAGAEDVAAALRWIRRSIADFGGNPDRVFVFGQSAGATHVAHYAFDEGVQNDGGNDGVAGVILQSPTVDPASAPAAPNLEAYFGPREGQAARSLLALVPGRRIPVFLSYAELDPPHFREQAARLREALGRRDGGAYPRTTDLKGHNHISEIAHVGSADDTAFGLELLEFVRLGR